MYIQSRVHQHICSKARKLIGMLHRRFSSWADTNTLRCLYLTCIRPHLEYASQLLDPYTNKGIQFLESVQKFACKVCLQQWNLDYDSMLQLLNFPPLSTRRNFLKLTTMYKIIGNFSYFPPGVFVQHNFPYSTNQEPITGRSVQLAYPSVARLPHLTLLIRISIAPVCGLCTCMAAQDVP